MNSFANYQQERSARVEHALERLLPAENQLPQRLHQAMRYAVLNGGKRLRPLLVYTVGEIFVAELAILDIAAAAVELIHAYSLVHDDLPAMDDDDLRRGKPSCHVAFDEATAILVGDALQSLAFAALANADSMSCSQRLIMLQTLAAACGSMGMVGGQCLDLQAIHAKLSLEQIEMLYLKKTGALIKASVQLALHAATQVTEQEQAALSRYAHYLGLGFQLRDDIQDIEGDMTSLGKLPGNDRKHRKCTYPEKVGIQQARAYLQGLYDATLTAIAPLEEKTTYLREIARTMLVE